MPCGERAAARRFAAKFHVCLALAPEQLASAMMGSYEPCACWPERKVLLRPPLLSGRGNCKTFRCAQCATGICITARLTLTIRVYLPLLLFWGFFFSFFYALLSNRLQLVEASLGRCCLAFKSCWFGSWHCLNQFYRVLPSVTGAISKVLSRCSKLV